MFSKATFIGLFFYILKCNLHNFISYILKYTLNFILYLTEILNPVFNVFTDFDECTTDPCPENSNCVNDPGSYHCECIIGYEYNTATRQCDSKYTSRDTEFPSILHVRQAKTQISLCCPPEDALFLWLPTE